MRRRKTKKPLLKKEEAGNDAEFVKRTGELSGNLFYISETDAEIRPFVGQAAKAVTGEEILSQVGRTKETPVEERNFSELFAGLTEIQDWFGDEEKETAERFRKLKEYLESNLTGLRAFKVGKIELDIYVVGLDADGKLMGIQTKAVET